MFLGLLNIVNNNYPVPINKTYNNEPQLNKADTSEKQAHFLDLNFSSTYSLNSSTHCFVGVGVTVAVPLLLKLARNLLIKYMYNELLLQLLNLAHLLTIISRECIPKIITLTCFNVDKSCYYTRCFFTLLPCIQYLFLAIFGSRRVEH